MVGRLKAVACDMIGTTFSLEPLRSALTDIGLPEHMLEVWFARTLRDAFALAATYSFAPLRALFDSNLDELVRSYSISIEKSQKDQVLGQFAALPAHPDAAQAFGALRDADIPVLALTNGAAATTKKLLETANLQDFVKSTVSVDDIGVFKPRREIYHAARIAGVDPFEMALIASHAWDIHGAKNAGLLAGFVARGQQYPGTMKAPDVVGASLVEVSRALVRLR